MFEHGNGVRRVERVVGIRKCASILHLRMHSTAAVPFEPLGAPITAAQEHRRRKDIRRDNFIATMIGEHGSEILGTPDIENAGARWWPQLTPHIRELHGAPVAHGKC